MSNQLSFDLGLPVIPEVKDKGLFPELLRIYNAIKITAAVVDNYTGRAPDLQDPDADTDITQLHTLGNFSKFSAVAAEPVVAGRMITFVSVGGEFRVRHPNTSWGQMAYAMCLKDAAAGEITIGMTCGVIKLSAAVLQVGLYRHVNDGYIGSTQDVGTSAQIIGYSLSPDALYIQPDLTFITSGFLP